MPMFPVAPTMRTVGIVLVESERRCLGWMLSGLGRSDVLSEGLM
jgi:hypothetical protein